MELSEEPERALATYFIKVEIGRHVPEDQGFHAIFIYKEVVSGIDGLKKAIAVGFNGLANYMERRLVSGIQDKTS